MLAPMQGITNRALRRLFVEWVRPDVVFTEFVRVRRGSRRGLSAADRDEVADEPGGIPLVVQLIGVDAGALVAAAQGAQEAGARHLNLNVGCPYGYGRMTPGSSGGALLGAPEALPSILRALRGAVTGGFSVKVRAGYEDPRQILSLLPLFEGEGVDFLVLHPRTVRQGYAGQPDHALTAEVVGATRLPVIANGDIVTAEEGRGVLAQTGAAGLMLGRGAVSDPRLFERLRGRAPARPTPEGRSRELGRYLRALVERYRNLFCGEDQVLYKLKEVVRHVPDPELADVFRDLKRCRTLSAFLGHLRQLESGAQQKSP
ncbi:MAG: tRNA-dihydrouridine synthase family protein [Deltaproteobacteria bacterium]|nr:tRNA-dihydrouridine synthase family protein [Deltaproteobacteria bacterium]